MANKYDIQFNGVLPPEDKALIIAGTLFVDYTIFENRCRTCMPSRYCGGIWCFTGQ